MWLMAGALALPGMGAGAAEPDRAFRDMVRQTLVEQPEIILEVFEKLEAQQAAARTATDRDLVEDLAPQLFEGLDPGKPILVGFQDYNCGYCRHAQAAVREVKSRLPDLQMVILETPVLGEASKFAANAALAVKHLEGQAAYAAVSDALMSLDEPANPDNVRRVILRLGFDAQKIAGAVENGVADRDLQRAARLARAIGATGTPVFVGPGGIVRGAGSATALEAITEAKGEGSQQQ